MVKRILPHKPVSFEWDEGNILKNWEKHKVSNDECEQIFANSPLKTYFDKKHSKVEERWFALGTTDNDRKTSVSFTFRKNQIRVISARDMSKKEKKMYEEKN